MASVLGRLGGGWRIGDEGLTLISQQKSDICAFLSLGGSADGRRVYPSGMGHGCTGGNDPAYRNERSGVFFGAFGSVSFVGIACGSSLIHFRDLSIIRVDRASLDTRPAARPTPIMLQSTRSEVVRPPVVLLDSLLLVAEHHPEVVRVVIRMMESPGPLRSDARERSRRPRRGAARSRS